MHMPPLATAAARSAAVTAFLSRQNKKPRHEVVTGQFLAQLHLFEVFRRDLRQLLRAGRQISIDPRIS